MSRAWRRRRETQPSAARPPANSTQVSGSGTAATANASAMTRCAAAVGWMPSQYAYSSQFAPTTAPQASVTLLKPKSAGFAAICVPSAEDVERA